jgi:putative FmdB family regulatory protein
MPIYVYKCEACGHECEEFQHIHDEPLGTCPNCQYGTSKCESRIFHRVPTAGSTTMREYRKPIQMHSIGLAHTDEINDFQRRNPDVKISRDENDPLYGVPIATSLHQKKAILKKEGFIDKNGY